MWRYREGTNGGKRGFHSPESDNSWAKFLLLFQSIKGGDFNFCYRKMEQFQLPGPRHQWLSTAIQWTNAAWQWDSWLRGSNAQNPVCIKSCYLLQRIAKASRMSSLLPPILPPPSLAVFVCLWDKGILAGLSLLTEKPDTQKEQLLQALGPSLQFPNWFKRWGSRVWRENKWEPGDSEWVGWSWLRGRAKW
jgi:hypothetical protein